MTVLAGSGLSHSSAGLRGTTLQPRPVLSQLGYKSTRSIERPLDLYQQFSDSSPIRSGTCSGAGYTEREQEHQASEIRMFTCELGEVEDSGDVPFNNWSRKYWRGYMLNFPDRIVIKRPRKID